MITVDFAVSPKGKPCIAMITKNGTQWLLLTTKKAPLASSLMTKLENGFKVNSLPGIPLDWRSSLEQRSMVFVPDNGCIGVYVQADRFDELVETLRGL